jgi:hypothetical protein
MGKAEKAGNVKDWLKTSKHTTGECHRRLGKGLWLCGGQSRID